MYDFYFYILLGLYIPLLIFTVAKLIKTKIFPQPNIPVTPGNIYKYTKARFTGKEIKNSITTPSSESLS